MNQDPYIRPKSRPAFDLSEAQIRYAMANSSSCKGAARFLNISYQTFKKYANKYIDSATGKTLFQSHRNIGNGSKQRKFKVLLEEILNGKHPNYPEGMFRKRMLTSQIIPVKCSVCDFSEHRITDDKIPLMLDYIDGNLENKSLDNLRWLCHNCYFLLVGGNVNGIKRRKIIS